MPKYTTQPTQKDRNFSSLKLWLEEKSHIYISINQQDRRLYVAKKSKKDPKPEKNPKEKQKSGARGLRLSKLVKSSKMKALASI